MADHGGARPRLIGWRRLLVLANLVLVGLGAVGFALVTLVAVGFTGDVPWLAVGAAGLGGVVVVHSVLALLGSVRPRLGLIVLGSIPFHALNALDFYDRQAEAALARRFVDGDVAASREAAAKLAGLGSRTGTRPASRVIGAGIPRLHDRDRLLGALTLLGQLVSSDSASANLLARYYQANPRPDGDSTIRRTALEALRKVEPYRIEPRFARLVGVSDAGLLRFALIKPHWVFGDSLAIGLLGFVVPRPSSVDPCEQRTASGLLEGLRSVLGSELVADLSEIRLRNDGDLAGSIGTLDQARFDRLRAALPTTLRDEPRPPVDWCHVPPRVRE